MDKFIFGAVMGVLSLLGLVMASRAEDSIFYATGLVFFVFGVATISWLIHKSTEPPHDTENA